MIYTREYFFLIGFLLGSSYLPILGYWFPFLHAAQQHCCWFNLFIGFLASSVVSCQLWDIHFCLEASCRITLSSMSHPFQSPCKLFFISPSSSSISSLIPDDSNDHAEYFLSMLLVRFHCHISELALYPKFFMEFRYLQKYSNHMSVVPSDFLWWRIFFFNIFLKLFINNPFLSQ